MENLDWLKLSGTQEFKITILEDKGAKEKTAKSGKPYTGYFFKVNHNLQPKMLMVFSEAGKAIKQAIAEGFTEVIVSGDQKSVVAGNKQFVVSKPRSAQPMSQAVDLSQVNEKLDKILNLLISKEAQVGPAVPF